VGDDDRPKTSQPAEPGKKWGPAEKAVIIAAVISGVFLVLAAAVTGIFGLLNQSAGSAASSVSSPTLMTSVAPSVSARAVAGQTLPNQNLAMTITYPANHAIISTPKTLHATGTVHNLPQGHHLVLFLQWNGQDRYWAGDLDIRVTPNGTWTGTACLGFPGSVRVWVADLSSVGLRALEQAPASYVQNGFPLLPEAFSPGIRMITYNTITAGQGGPGCQQNMPQLY